MRALVTGTSGYVGGTVAAHLIKRGWEVLGLDRAQPSSSGFRHIQADIASQLEWETLAERVPDFDCIIHAAAAIDHGLYEGSIALANCYGMQQMIKLAVDRKAESFIFFSSVPVIGKPKQLPVTEEHPIEPPTAYHASKLFGEQLLRLCGESEDLKCVAFRLTSPVGPGRAPKRIFSVFCDRALAGEPILLAGRGGRRQNYVDVRDIARAVEQCLDRRASGLYNVAGSTSLSNLALAEACVRVLNSSSRVELSGAPDQEETVSWDVSIEKAHDTFGFSPAYGIEQSILDYTAEKRHDT